MRTIRALAVSAAAVAALGFAAPAAMASSEPGYGERGAGESLDDSGRAYDDADPGDYGRFGDSGSWDDEGPEDGWGEGNSGSGQDDGPRNIRARPGVVVQGGPLTVAVDGDSCRRPGSAVSSRAFRTTWLRRSGAGTATARVFIDRGVRPGSYDITARCGEDRTLTRPAAFTVVGGVRGGLGGGTSTGATPTDIAIGSGLVAAAVLGGGVLWLRRRSGRRI
ncbi:hypothetical protein OHB41_40155 [Streptomyces sp. NBC_01571]|uniref:hypothetical protein n=1 Tax=Streptomyces sp. NBC_01571 TaxID=2975883 RepID=UPI00224DDC77|nr:hypothetical protein [Streptomyces sp. NBC_01571]MCX4579290.1 hypothetical protein [Streptomyces sp. NBC_01571]